MIMMTKCPKCRKEVMKHRKIWKYGTFTVRAYFCPFCQTKFMDYEKQGRNSFTLRLEKGRGYVKA